MDSAHVLRIIPVDKNTAIEAVDTGWVLRIVVVDNCSGRPPSIRKSCLLRIDKQVPNSPILERNINYEKARKSRKEINVCAKQL